MGMTDDRIDDGELLQKALRAVREKFTEGGGPTTVGQAIEYLISNLPEACGEEHHVGDEPNDCFACLAWNTTADLDWLHKLANIRVGKNREHGDRNSWTCETCGDAVWTIDVDEGVTPMILLCRIDGCSGEAISACYNVGPPGAAPKPTHRWVRPRSLAGLGAERQHVEKGGLILEEIPEAERETVDPRFLTSGSRREGADVR